MNEEQVGSAVIWSATDGVNDNTLVLRSDDIDPDTGDEDFGGSASFTIEFTRDVDGLTVNGTVELGPDDVRGLLEVLEPRWRAYEQDRVLQAARSDESERQRHELDLQDHPLTVRAKAIRSTGGFSRASSIIAYDLVFHRRECGFAAGTLHHLSLAKAKEIETHMLYAGVTVRDLKWCRTCRPAST